MDLDLPTTEKAPTTSDRKTMLGNFSEEMGFPDPVFVHIVMLIPFSRRGSNVTTRKWKISLYFPEAREQ